MVEFRSASGVERALGVTLGLLVALGSPARALAQTPVDAGSSGWNLPEEPTESDAPAEPAPPDPNGEPPADSPPAELPALPSAQAPPPPAELPPLRPVESPPPTGPRFPVTIVASGASVVLRGPGIERSVTCERTCDWKLRDGTYWFEVHVGGGIRTVPVTVTGPLRVVVQKPSEELRALGIITIILGGSVFIVAGLATYTIALTCAGMGDSQCHSDNGFFPWLAATGVAAGVSGVGIGLFVANNKPSLDIVSKSESRARREPGTFVGFAPIGGGAPGLSLRASF